MSALFIATATVRLGQTTTDKDGNVIKHTKPSCEFDPAGGSVIVGKLKITDDSMEPDGPVDVFGDWDAAAYLRRALEIIEPKRRHNIPDFEGIIKDVVAQSIDKDCPFIERCKTMYCRDCIVNEWTKEAAGEC